MRETPVILVFCSIVHCLNAELTVSEFIVSTNSGLFVHDNKIAQKIVADNTSRNVAVAREEITQDVVNTALPIENVATDSQVLPVLPTIEPESNKSGSILKNDSNILTNNTIEPAVVEPVGAIEPPAAPAAVLPPVSAEIQPTATAVEPTEGVAQVAVPAEPVASGQTNSADNCNCSQLKPDTPTTTEVPISEEVILVYPEPQPEPEEPPTVNPDNLVDIRLAYFLANNLAGHETRPIIFKPHYIRNRPAWSAIYQRPSYAQWGPYFRGEDTENKERANLFPQIVDPTQNDDILLTRKEIMKMRLNQLRVSKMIPDLHPQKLRESSIVIDPSKIPAEPSPTVQWEIPRKFFSWPTFWPFSLFISSDSDSDKTAPKAEEVNRPQVPVQAQGQGQVISTSDASPAAQSQRHIGNQFKINPFLEFGQNWHTQ